MEGTSRLQENEASGVPSAPRSFGKVQMVHHAPQPSRRPQERLAGLAVAWPYPQAWTLADSSSWAQNKTALFQWVSSGPGAPHWGLPDDQVKQNSLWEWQLPVNLYNEFPPNQSENKMQLRKQGSGNGNTSLRIFSLGPKYLHSDLHLICI